MAELGASTRRTPPGWYDDTAGRARWRYWDGSAWTPWIASGSTAVPDALGAPDAVAPSPASRAKGPHPRDVEPGPVVLLPAWHLGGQPTTPDPDSEPVVWLFTAIFGAAIAGIGAGLYTQAPPYVSVEDISSETILGFLLIAAGLVVLGIALLVFVVTVATQLRNDRRRRR